jgi:glutathionyl-hydroquinone reductase
LLSARPARRKPTLDQVRFDEVYVVYFKCSKKCLREYPNLLNVSLCLCGERRKGVVWV